MRFTKYQPRYTQKAISVRVNKGNLNISMLAYLELGKPERVSIFYDVQALAIRIEKDAQGLKVNMPAPHIGCSIYKLMPKGIYFYDSEKKCFIQEKEDK